MAIIKFVMMIVVVLCAVVCFSIEKLTRSLFLRFVGSKSSKLLSNISRLEAMSRGMKASAQFRETVAYFVYASESNEKSK